METRHERAVKMMSREIPAIVMRKCNNIEWLCELNAYEIADGVRFVLGFIEIHRYRLTRDEMKYMLKTFERGVRCEMEKFNPSVVNEYTIERRMHCIEMLINMVCDVYYNNNEFIIKPVPENDLPEKIELVFKDEKYQDIVIKVKSADDIYIRKMWEQYKSGKDLTDINIDYNECKKEYEDYKNGKVKKVVDMYDVETKEVIYTFNSRNECIEQTGISKSNLAQCISSSRDEEGWRKWKDKTNNKYYYFKEREM